MDRSAADQIQENLSSRLDDLRHIATRLNRASLTSNDGKYDAAMDEYYEYPLGVTRYTVWRIDLSAGGPGDWFEVQTDDDGSVTRIEYHFAPWFDHASVTLDGEGADVVEAFARVMTADFATE